MSHKPFHRANVEKKTSVKSKSTLKKNLRKRKEMMQTQRERLRLLQLRQHKRKKKRVSRLNLQL